MNDLQQLQALVGFGGTPDEFRSALHKAALTASNGFVGYNLEAEAKLMLPVFAGLRNRVAVDRPKQGALAATWKMQLGYGSYNFGTNMGTVANQVGADPDLSAIPISANYTMQSVHGDVGWNAISQSRGYDDANAIETAADLSILLKHDELNVLGGNQAAVTPPVVTAAPSTLSTANTFAAGTWHVKVTAVTLQGAQTNAAANSNVGESAVSNSAAVVVPGGDSDFLDVSWPAVAGAVGYKVYIERTAGGGTFYLCDPATMLKYAKFSAGAIDLTALGDPFVVPTGQTFVGVTRVQVYAIPTAVNAAPGSDGSANANVFEGFFAWCQKNTIYGQALGQNHINKDLGGAPLTSVGTGVLEFDQILNTLWSIWNTSPTLIITSPNGVTSLGNKIAAMNNASTLRTEVYQDRNKIVGGLYIGGYTNKFASSMAGMQASVDVWAHPYCPDGSFLFLSERIPYPYSREPRGFALDVLTPYTYFELGRTTLSFPFSIFDEQTLKCYHPLAQASIQGARVDN
jgi:hypothetical protein